VEIIASYPTDIQSVPIVVVVRVQTLEGTPSNPIRLDEDNEDLVEIHKWYPLPLSSLN
jgi:hypothetical protein